MNDPIVEEVRKIRDAHAARFNYDLDAIFRDIKEQEKKSGRNFVSYPPRKLEPDEPVRPSEAGIPPSPELQSQPAASPVELE